MIRFLNVLAILAMIGSATWAYSVKYETILVAEKLKKRQGELRQERDAIAILEAEWQLLNRPARLAVLAQPEQGMQQLSAKQVVEPRDIPAASPNKADPLDQLLTGALAGLPAPKTTDGVTLPARSTAMPLPKPAQASAGQPKTGHLKTRGAKASATRKTPGQAKVGTPLSKANTARIAPGTGVAGTSATHAAKTKSAGPMRLIPPAPVGASAPPPKRAQSGLTGLLNKLTN